MAVTGEARAEPDVKLRVAWWNDVFSERSPADDTGFTSDFEVDVWIRLHRGTVRARMMHRTITERFSRRRWDQLDLIVAYEDELRPRRDTYVELAGRAGLTFGGNFGGCAVQNTWHELTGSGITVDEGLQNQYDGGRRAAVLGGLRAALVHGVSIAKLRAGTDAQATLGNTGVATLGGFAGGDLSVPIRRWRLLLTTELALIRYWTSDPNLTLRSAYGVGEWQRQFRVGLGAGIGATSFGWQYRSNEGGSGEPTGVVWFSTAW